MEMEGYFISESITRGSLSRNYSSVGPSAARGIWVDILAFSLKKAAPAFAEIEPSSYYIGAVPPSRKGDRRWEKPLAALVKSCGRKIPGPTTIFHMPSLSRELPDDEPPSKWLPEAFSRPFEKGLFGTFILLSVPRMSGYLEACAAELGCTEISTEAETGRLSLMFKGRDFKIDTVGLIKKMAYGGFTKEFLAASLLAYLTYDSEQKPPLSAVRRADFPNEDGVYSL
ncbi:MAG TPA: hypothetical protein PKJ97_00825 [Candidatus Bilamarchaeaceae archaeon]|nr:hypothetical protein [Candidatus Bilamarchaeaceae archaeon]